MLESQLLDGEPGLFYVCGPAGSGKTRLLEELAARTADAILVDAAGRDADSVVAELVERYPSRRGGVDLMDLISAARNDRTSRTVLIANVHRAGTLLSGGSPGLLRGVVRWLRIATREGRLRLVVESEVAPDLTDPVEARRTTVVELPPGIEASARSVDAIAAEDVPALRALAHAQLARLPIDGWALLCRAAGLPVTAEQLAKRLPGFGHLEQDGDGIGFRSFAMARELREGYGNGTALHARMTEALMAGALTSDWERRSLPGHAAAAGLFDQLLADARVLAHIPYDALVEGFRACYPDGIEQGSHAAALHYLTGYGLAGATQGEWVAHLAHDAVARGDRERARALAEFSPEPLLFHTVWSRLRLPGDRTVPGPWHENDLENVGALEYRGRAAVASEDEDEVGFVLAADTGELLAGPVPDALEHPELSAAFDKHDPEAGQLAISADWRRTSFRRDGELLGILHHPAADYAAMTADTVVLIGKQGAYAVRVDTARLRPGPDKALRPMIGAHGRILPKPFDPALFADPRRLLEQVFGPEHIHRRDDPPATITHTPTRQTMTGTGLPHIEWLLGITLDPTGELPTRPWQSIPEAAQPTDSGPFHLLGDWLGVPLLLDGSSGRVLRMLRADSPAYLFPRDHLLGTSLEQFVLMLALLQHYLRIYRAAGSEREQVLTELRALLPAVDPLANSDSWQHVLHFDEWH
ncbi:SUKH-4 family immunity protein [Nocardia yamanashiensis]|uniref:SUKH-4 family immunity protein n=1 Tax=Nocardia yamanashiensis TaxID=209247 RepID=UPI001E581E19|nr:SUKH-4 family immunity protein [Nocardia yamanashiensis]UGT44553.1 SUKH-4 family immunity protein [Nocardia yamanashiensis]